MRTCKFASVRTEGYECARDERAAQASHYRPRAGRNRPSPLQLYSSSVMSCRLRHVQLREQNVKHPHWGGRARGSTAARTGADAPADVPATDQARDASSGARRDGYGAAANDGAAAYRTRALPRAQLRAPADAGRT